MPRFFSVPSVPSVVTAVAILLMLACAPRSPRPPAPVPPDPCCFADALSIAERYRQTAITTRRFTPNAYWGALAAPLASPRFRVEPIGKSVQGRPLVAITVGTGAVSVLAWSQMHGDESTASLSLLDLAAWLADTVPDPLRERLLSAVTLTLVPMLNPDGAELFQRQNALGVDVNRDARRLSSPEARALKALHDRLKPAFGFNLHDQNARQTAGRPGLQAAVAVLAPAIDAKGTYDAVRSRARLVASRIASQLGSVIPGRIARYDDGFNPRAFGDLIQTWGTSTVLIEAGAIPGDPQKQLLRRYNAAAFLDAVLAIGEGRYASADPAVYDRLRENTGVSYDLLVRGAKVVGLGPEPYVLDLGIVYGDAVAKTDARVSEVGDLAGSVALDTTAADGLFLHPEPAMLTIQDGRRWLRIGNPARYTLRRGPDRSSEAVVPRSVPGGSP